MWLRSAEVGESTTLISSNKQNLLWPGMEVISFLKVTHDRYCAENGIGKDGSGRCLLDTASMTCRRTIGPFYLIVGDLLEIRHSRSLIWNSTNCLVNL